MSIQWYPGHMTKARKVLDEAMPLHDVVVEVLDARMPRASDNPLVDEVRRHKPCLKVLAKSDLADPAVTEAWLAHLSGREVLALAITSERRADAKKRVPELCRRLVPHRAGKSVRALVLGVPNVGKSTLINTLVGRKATQVGDKPAVTRALQRVEVDATFAISDFPGMTWPKIGDERTGLALAFCGSIPDTAIDLETVALYGAARLLADYPSLVVARYKLTALPADAEALLDEIGRRRGALRAGGVVDRDKAAAILIHDFRSGLVGRVSLERPPPARAAAPSLDEDGAS